MIKTTVKRGRCFPEVGLEVLQSSRSFLINGKLEVFVVTFPKRQLLETMDEYCNCSSVDEFLKIFNFSLAVSEAEGAKVL